MTPAEHKRAWYLRNREKILAKSKTRDKVAKAEYDKQRREDLKEHFKDYDKQRNKLPHRKAQKREHTRKRVMTLKQATPSWLSELDQLIIKEIYHLAVLRSEALGVDFDVDHIIPLHGTTVSGLHVPSNLQLLPRSQNIRKKNYFELI